MIISTTKSPPSRWLRPSLHHPISTCGFGGELDPKTTSTTTRLGGVGVVAGESPPVEAGWRNRNEGNPVAIQAHGLETGAFPQSFSPESYPQVAGWSRTTPWTPQARGLVFDAMYTKDGRSRRIDLDRKTLGRADAALWRIGELLEPQGRFPGARTHRKKSHPPRRRKR